MRNTPRSMMAGFIFSSLAFCAFQACAAGSMDSTKCQSSTLQVRSVKLIQRWDSPAPGGSLLWASYENYGQTVSFVDSDFWVGDYFDVQVDYQSTNQTSMYMLVQHQENASRHPFFLDPSTIKYDETYAVRLAASTLASAASPVFLPNGLLTVPGNLPAPSVEVGTTGRTVKTLKAGRFRQSDGRFNGGLWPDGAASVAGGVIAPTYEGTRVALSDTKLYFVILQGGSWSGACVLAFPFLKSTHNMY